MKSTISLAHHVTLILFTLFLPVFCALGRNCTLPAAPPAAPAAFPKSELVDFYYESPSHQSPADSLDRLESESTIRRKLTLYSLAFDGKNFSTLDRIFTKDAAVDLGPPFGQVKGLETIRETLATAAATGETQSLLGTQTIKVYKDNPCTASSLTYFAVTVFGQGEFEGTSYIWQGDFRDRWYRNEAGEWLILYRLTTFAGTPIVISLSTEAVL